MNLGSIELRPLKTKAVARNGNKYIFVCDTSNEPSNAAVPFLWMLWNGTGPSTLRTNHEGLPQVFHDAPGDLELVRIIPRWVPQAGDVVLFKGMLARADGRDFARVLSDQEMTISRAHHDPGFYYLRFRSDEYLGYRDSMRLVRRAGTQQRT